LGFISFEVIFDNKLKLFFSTFCFTSATKIYFIFIYV